MLQGRNKRWPQLMNRITVLILVGLLSCKRDNAIQIWDLKFPDPESAFIKKNRIDTTLLFIPQENAPEARFYKTYDEDGNILVDSTDFALKILNYYDARGLLVKRETRGSRSVWTDSISYDFDPYSLILTQKWSVKNAEFRFYFDENLRVFKKLEIDRSRKSRNLISETRYVYDDDFLIRCLIYTNSKSVAEIENNYYYYSRYGVLDSITLRTSSGYRQGWVYDSLGLLNSEWSNAYKGGERFIHKRRK